jgi:hypothetical protein
MLFKELKEKCYQFGLKGNGIADYRNANLSNAALQEASKFDQNLKDYISSHEETILQFC